MKAAYSFKKELTAIRKMLTALRRSLQALRRIKKGDLEEIKEELLSTIFYEEEERKISVVHQNKEEEGRRHSSIFDPPHFSFLGFTRGILFLDGQPHLVRDSLALRPSQNCSATPAS
ncbi:hypothetical protein V7G09_10370 [Cutibacterium avidum]|uniref:hypothetical protein n=1 Tax=Cutibacterium avidum TaxID=33010 RepID=UPI0029073860|nr:hypothetical protein [Propionibacterium sp.]MDU4922231.1 hypothetical protein [Cutibacterium avidum]MDU5547221.1 hypothetical protein [Cutibacterium avidum]MDU5655709.1 hypothetical protein [Cutibacterium avidum]MDU5830961.1 hypothetical protein [Cutibacterium avidum]